MLFESLHDALDKLFDNPLTSLPMALQQRIEKEYFPISWDSLSADQRRKFAIAWDDEHDPAMESDRQYWWDFYQRKQAIEAHIEQWSAIAAPTATDLAKQEARLTALKLELAEMKRQEHQQQRVGKQRERITTEKQGVTNLKYIAYPKAMKMLSERLKATPEEMAAWLFLEPGLGGLVAYLHVDELDPPPTFSFARYTDNDDPDYIGPMMGCYFRIDDVVKFQPVERFITGKMLIKRWSEKPDIHPRGFIQAKIKESRLLDLHPIYGGTDATFSGNGSHPPLETGLFSLAQIEEIEKSDFSDDVNDVPATGKPAGHLNHDPEMQKMANEMATEIFDSTGRVPTKDKVARKLADKIEIPFDTVLRRIRAEWKKKSPTKYKKLPHK